MPIERRYTRPPDEVTILEDPILGRLSTPLMPGWWEGEFVSAAFGCEIGLTVEGPASASGAGPDAAQRAVFARFRERESDLRAVIQQALFEHYRSLRPDQIDPVGEAPVISSAGDLWRHVRPTSLYLPDPAREPGREVFILAF